MVNVLIQSVNISVDANNGNNLLLLVDVGTNPKLPPNVRILASSLPQMMVGPVITSLLNVLEVPSLSHINRIPASVELSEDGPWVLSNFTDEDKKFSAEEVVQAINAAIEQHAASQSE